MGNCFSDPTNFDAEVDLYHFDLHRAVGKGAFGKVCLDIYFSVPRILTCVLLGPSRRAQEDKEALCSQVH